jgi:hypothetical protein
MIICSNKTFYFSFISAMLMQESKYAKVENNSCNAKSEYG